MRVLLLTFFLLCVASAAEAAPYVAPKRTKAQVIFAIGHSRPGLTKANKQRLAGFVIDVAKKHNFDPLSGWAIIDHESGWRANAVGPDGEDIGLAQIRYTQGRACRGDRDSKACAAWRTTLMDPAVNIRMMGYAISAWRKLCTKVTGRPPNMQNWLAGYGGYSKPKRHIYCGRKRVRSKKGKWLWKELAVPKPVADILAARKRMIAQLKNQSKKRSKKR